MYICRPLRPGWLGTDCQDGGSTAGSRKFVLI